MLVSLVPVRVKSYFLRYFFNLITLALRCTLDAKRGAKNGRIERLKEFRVGIRLTFL